MTTTVEQVTTEGTVAYYVGRYGSRTAACGNGITRPIYVGAQYRAVRRKRDGVLTWRRIGNYGPDRAGGPSRRLIRELKGIAGDRWQPAGHGRRCP